MFCLGVQTQTGSSFAFSTQYYWFTAIINKNAIKSKSYTHTNLTTAINLHKSTVITISIFTSALTSNMAEDCESSRAGWLQARYGLWAGPGTVSRPARVLCSPSTGERRRTHDDARTSARRYITTSRPRLFFGPAQRRRGFGGMAFVDENPQPRTSLNVSMTGL